MCFLLFQSGLVFSKGSFNLSILPDPVFNCHQLGFDAAITDKSSLGVLARYQCNSDRPTYGSPNKDVKNTFSRILIPWRYSFNGVFEDGFIMQLSLGMEKSRFKSDLGSEAEVTFMDIVFSVGYQWFWGNGLNVSVIGGPAFLIKNSVNKNLSQNESSDVIKFLDKNTKSNVHAGVGVLLGWSF